MSQYFMGNNSDQRKVWIEEQLQRLAAFFGIELLCFAIRISNENASPSLFGPNTTVVNVPLPFWPKRPIRNPGSRVVSSSSG